MYVYNIKAMKVYIYTLGCKVNQYESQALSEDFKAADEEAARAACRVANQFILLRVEHLHHEFDNRARGEELADFATEGATKEALERNSFHVLAGFR